MLEGWDARVQAALLREVGARVTGILDTTRDMIQQEVERGLNEGLSPGALADNLEDAAAFSEYRSELIARTESATFLNQAAIANYDEFGVTHVEVIDGENDDECAAANGQIWTLEEANANPIAHPNCVRDFVPVLDDRTATSDTSTTSSEGRDEAALDQASKDFHDKYQANPIETGAILDEQGNILHLAGGVDPELLTATDKYGYKVAGGAVDWEGLPTSEFRGNIITHTHPGGNTPLSDGDVAHAIAHDAAEIRAEARDYSYRLRPGREDGNWFEPIEGRELRGETNTAMRNFYEEYTERISSDPQWLADRGLSNPADWPKGFDIVEAWLDDGWRATAQEFGWIYERVPYEK